MTEDFIQTMKHKLQEKGLATSDDLVGCNEQEINSAMNTQGVRRLPKVFKDFLLAMGKKTGKLWSRAVFNSPDIERLKHSAQSLLNFNGNPIALPDDAFVFFMEEGIVFFYFLTNNLDDNPAVFMYHEVEYEHTIVDEHLSDFLLNIYS